MHAGVALGLPRAVITELGVRAVQGGVHAERAKINPNDSQLHGIPGRSDSLVS